MLTIRINEFEGYGIDEFTLFLDETDDDKTYEIVIPKITTALSSGVDIAWEFFTGACIGERLSEISTVFSYIIAEQEFAGQFRFKIKTELIHELAGILLQTSGAFGNSEEANPVNFASQVHWFIVRSKNKQAICQDVVDIANKYHSETDD